MASVFHPPFYPPFKLFWVCDVRAQAQVLRLILAATKTAYEELINEIEAANTRYGETCNRLSRETNLLRQEASAVREMLANFVGDIVALSVLAHTNNAGSDRPVRHCAQTLFSHVSTNFGVSYDQFFRRAYC